ncbi:metallophosphoesterase [Methylacidiphilum sp. Yel]|jgi:putative phosphoesterase|uniref:metallophosphoesterase family protein n=1 Tax=Methylacidiphilum sp. Yel TaxID=1847730 RepID=UPI00106C99CC|nr:metallophosphoesterase family protein [Methylacidiphilum sp. Yel]TFE66865.1 metallophosphoesterase [Methylacidiphilum sp. Yel]
MKIAFLSDIHGNLEALESVLEEIAKIKVDKIICLGDVVGYGAEPSRCLRKIREQAEIILMGNHDYYCSLPQIPEAMTNQLNPIALKAIHFTRSILSKEEKQFLASLPLIWQNEDLMAVHSNFRSPTSWQYVLSNEEAEENFRAASFRIGFLGHTHIVALFVQNDHSVFQFRFKRLFLKENFRFLLNVGSVGQPRDGDPRATFVVYQTENYEATLYRVAYDIEKSALKIKNANLPIQLAERLRWGV